MGNTVKVVSYVARAIAANKKGTDKGLHEIAIKVTAQTKLNITSLKAVDTGQLRSSYLWNKVKDAYYVGSAVLHAIYIEYGTRKMAARPAFRMAIDMVTRGTSAAEAMKKYMLESVQQAVPK